MNESSSSAPPSEEPDVARVETLATSYESLRENIGRVIVGQQDVIEEMLIALFGGGHSILVGLPGLGKTLLVNTLSRLLDLSFHRIQFTPDLMPSDITGTDVLHEDQATGSRDFRFVEGPVFANMILADEINRTPPKTQAALLEAMQEHRVTVGQTSHRLPEPFFVVATQNPIEQEGTYHLPEAQLDRFLLSIHVAYPDEDDELEIIRRSAPANLDDLSPIMHRGEILDIQRLVPRVPAPEHVLRFALAVVRATRPDGPKAPDYVRQFLHWGAGPRAAQSLVVAAKSRAILHGRPHASVDDIRRVAPPVLRHRLVMNFRAGAEGVDAESVVSRLVNETPDD